MNKTLHAIHKRIYIFPLFQRNHSVNMCWRMPTISQNLSKTKRLHLKTSSRFQADNSWCW